MKLVGTSTPRPPSTSWRNDAACSGDMGAMFYPPVRPERRSAKAARELNAKQICAGCPVREDCLEQALRVGERYGIWGGLTDVERQLLRAS